MRPARYQLRYFHHANRSEYLATKTICNIGKRAAVNRRCTLPLPAGGGSVLATQGLTTLALLQRGASTDLPIQNAMAEENARNRTLAEFMRHIQTGAGRNVMVGWWAGDLSPALLAYLPGAEEHIRRGQGVLLRQSVHGRVGAHDAGRRTAKGGRR